MLAHKISLLMVDLILTLSYGFGITITPCSHAVKGSSCSITCTTPDFSKDVEIKCNGLSQGNCGGFGCSSGMGQHGTTTTYLEIASLSYSSHLCEWSCTYGTSDSNKFNLTIYSGISPHPNTTGIQNGNNVQLETIVDCLHPSNPTVKVQYSSRRSDSYQTLQEQPVSLRSSSGMCGNAVENRVTATSEVSGDMDELQGKTVFFRMMFLQYPNGNTTASVAIDGPFYFEGCASDGELFMRGFSLFIIEIAVFIVIIILLKLEKMGGFTKLKLVVSCVFLTVALIIGIILGVVLMVCSKKDLSLGLGIGLGCALASAHFATICGIHKKNASKKDDVDKERKGKDSHASPVTENGTQLKESNRPLPEPPATRRNKLEPIPQENDAVTTSEKKKKKKKKKKRKNTESTDALKV